VAVSRRCASPSSNDPHRIQLSFCLLARKLRQPSRGELPQRIDRYWSPRRCPEARRHATHLLLRRTRSPGQRHPARRSERRSHTPAPQGRGGEPRAPAGSQRGRSAWCGRSQERLSKSRCRRGSLCAGSARCWAGQDRDGRPRLMNAGDSGRATGSDFHTPLQCSGTAPLRDAWRRRRCVGQGASPE